MMAMTVPDPSAPGPRFDDTPSGPGQHRDTTTSLGELTELVDQLTAFDVPGESVELETVVRVTVPHNDRTLSVVRRRNVNGPYWSVRLSWATPRWSSVGPAEAAAYVAAVLVSERERTLGREHGDHDEHAADGGEPTTRQGES